MNLGDLKEERRLERTFQVEAAGRMETWKGMGCLGGQQVPGFIARGGLGIGVEAKVSYQRALNAVLEFGLLS